MSEFTRCAESFLYDTDDPYRWGREVQDLLRTLDARVRALEGKASGEIKWTTEQDAAVEKAISAHFGPPNSASISGCDPAIVRDVHADAVRAAVLAERERCAKVAECYDLGTTEGHGIAAEIRRG